MADFRTRQIDELLSRHTGHQGSRKARKRRFVYQGAYVAGRLVNRTVELIVATLLVVFCTLPCGLVLLIRKMVTGKPVLLARDIVGGNGGKVTVYTYACKRPIVSGLFLFLHVIAGQLALAGTAMTDWEDRPVGLEQGYIRTIKPGVFSLWYVRKASKIAHEGHDAIEWEYLFRKNLLFDFFLLLRTIPAFFFQSGSRENDDQLHLFGLDIANLTMQDGVGLLKGFVQGTSGKSIYFVNPDCLNKIFSDPSYFQVLEEGDLVLPDGIGLTIAGNLLQTPLKENVNGTDLLPYLCEMAALEGYSLFLLGGRPGIAAAMAEQLRKQFKVRVAGTAHGYFDRKKENSAICEQINRSGADILLVAFGAPLQEKWIAENKTKLKARVQMGVGGLFDFYSGRTRRAPRWLREIGLEWFYRMLQEPGRMWKRYVVGNPLFLYRVVRWKLYAESGVRVPDSTG